MYQIKIGDKEFEVVPAKGSTTSGTLNGKEYAMDVIGTDDDYNVILDNKSHNVTLVDADYEGRTFTIRVNSNEYTLEARDQFDLLLEELGMEDMVGSKLNDLKAPMPGLVLKINVKPGDEIKKGDPLLVLEAMKMENILKAEGDAVIKAIHTETSKAVEKNQVLIEFEA